MKGKNIGGYDKNYKYDRKAVNFLEGFLLESDLIVPHFEAEDKLPNLDGYLEICEPSNQKINPIGRFDVQIKSLNHNYCNDNVCDNIEYSYKYSCDTKVVNVVLEALTYNPVLLILVDNRDKRIFWKYMSEQYCLELDVGTKVKKTLYFNETDEITDSNEWYDILHNIYRKYSFAQRDEEEALFLLADKEQTIPSMVQDMSDYLNNMLDNELWFIKQSYFPDTWKIGIAYLDDSKNSFSCIGLYKIKREKNDLFIKQFKSDSEYFVSIHYGGGYSIEDIIKHKLENWIERFFERDNYYLSLFPDVVLSELFFKEIDSTLARLEMGDRTKRHVVLGWRGNSMSKDEFEKLYNKISHNQLIFCIMEELEKRGIEPVYRPWKKIVDYHISKEDKHCIEYKEDFDREEVDKSNMKKFLGQFEEFFEKNKKKFGRCSEKVFELKNTYILVVEDNMEGYVYGVKESNSFSVEVYFKSENEDLYKEIVNDFSHTMRKYVKCGSTLLVSCNYSWYKLWRILNRTLFLSYIDAERDYDVATEYIRSL